MNNEPSHVSWKALFLVTLPILMTMFAAINSHTKHIELKIREIESKSVSIIDYNKWIKRQEEKDLRDEARASERYKEKEKRDAEFRIEISNEVKSIRNNINKLIVVVTKIGERGR